MKKMNPPISLRCTKKLLDEFKRFHMPLSEMEVDSRYEWHVNIFCLDRKKCLLFTHTTTLYAVFVFGVLKKDIVNIGDTFWTNLKMHFEADGLDIKAYSDMEADAGKFVAIKKTNNRHVTGSMNDYRYIFEGYYFDLRRTEPWIIVSISQKINRMPMSYIKYDFSIDRMRKMLNQSSG